MLMNVCHVDGKNRQTKNENKKYVKGQKWLLMKTVCESM